jgi:hypothetical protein
LKIGCFFFLLLQKNKPNVPFKRVKSDEILIDKRLADNSFEAKVCGYIYIYLIGYDVLIHSGCAKL